MIARILCRLGLHSWSFIRERRFLGEHSWQAPVKCCDRCGKRVSL